LASGRGTVQIAVRAAQADPEGFAKSALITTAGNPNRITTGEIVRAFRAGDAWVHAIIEQSIAYLGQAVAAIHLAVGVEEFILVGGFARALGEPYLRLLRLAVGNAQWDLGCDWDKMLCFGYPDDDDGLVGAALYALQGVGH
jgi:glucokinase